MFPQRYGIIHLQTDKTEQESIFNNSLEVGLMGKGIRKNRTVLKFYTAEDGYIFLSVD